MKNVNTTRWLFVSMLIGLQSGCGIGYNSVLFITVSNAGFQADTAPPVVEVGISRFEGVVAPAFEGGQTPPVFASFGQKAKGTKDPTITSGSIFAAGPAAVAATVPAHLSVTGQESAMPPERLLKAYEEAASLLLSEEPRYKGDDRQVSVVSRKSLLAPGEAAPMWFGVTESAGLMLELFGPNFIPAPQSLHVGYRRKEFLYAPLTIERVSDSEGKLQYRVRILSILALVNLQEPSRRMNYFATGTAATQMAAQNVIRDLVTRHATGSANPEPGDEAENHRNR